MPADPEGSIAGARLADGRLIFVAGTPADLQAGARIMLRWGEDEYEAVVSLAPSLLIWADPTVPLGRFLHMGTGEMAPPPIPAEPPLALWLAESGAPAPARLAAMVALARDERGRLEE